MVSTDFSDLNNGAACGFVIDWDFLGRVVYTNNSGDTWNMSNYPSSCLWLRQIQMLDSLNGYIVGDHDIREQSENINIPDGIDISEEVGVFNRTVSDNSTDGAHFGALLMRTSDGGRNWFIPENFSGGAYAFTDLNFLNENTGYVTAQFSINKGYEAGLMKTKDGGVTWDTIYKDFNISLYNIIIFENDFIIVAGMDRTNNSGFLMKSVDDGQNWIITSFPTNVEIANIDFTNSNTGICVGIKNYRTTNKGETWEEFKIISDTAFSYFMGFEFLKGTGTAVTTGVHYHNSHYYPVILKTNDYGNSWIKNVTPFLNPESPIFSVSVTDENTWHSCGGRQGALILYTNNGGTVGISNSYINLDNYSLSQNYPNPFNPKTIINYQLIKSGLVSLKVYDILGNEVTTLINGKQNPGSHQIEFDGSNLSSGIYFYKLNAGEFSETKRMALIK